MRIQRFSLLYLVALPLLAACGDPAFVGRRGNTHLELEQFLDAREAYREGLTRTDSLPSRTRMAFLHNTGLAYLAEQNRTEALAAFEAAALAAPTPHLRAEAFYHAGLAAYGAEQRQTALDRFRAALLLRENDDDARFNWEVVRRQMKNEQNRSGGPPPPTPSDFAIELKKRAEKLAAQRRYREAHMLMQQGLQQDETVQAFGDFIQRLGTVADINALSPMSPR